MTRIPSRTLALSLGVFAALPAFASAPSAAELVDGPFIYDEILLGRDDRPVDGALTEIRLDGHPEGERAGTYDLTLRHAYYDRIGGKAVDETTSLLSQATCQVKRSFITCVRDMMPVDGPYVEIQFVRKEGGSFDVTKTTKLLSRRQGGMVETKEDVAQGLEILQITP